MVRISLKDGTNIPYNIPCTYEAINLKPWLTRGSKQQINQSMPFLPGALNVDLRLHATSEKCHTFIVSPG